MNNLITILLMWVFPGLVFAQNLGVGTTPTQKVDVAGWIEVGNQTQGSTATTGTIRYNTSVGKMQYYNGSSWVSMGGSSATFTRWGRDDCPSTASLVYWGYASGSHYQHSGSGINHVCLHNSPEFGGHNDGDHNGTLFYGTEFETGSYGIITMQNRQNYDARCAVCKVADVNSAVLVPGTNSCPSGWTLQYWGYLMSTHYTQHRSTFVCVDNNPEFHGSTANHNGNLWYPTEAEPGAMSFTPYVIDREITCSLCTK